MKSTKKPKTSAQLKKILDKHFSIFIRMRDTNTHGFGKCYTCPKIIHYKQGHCGHFIPRNILITRWDEENCRLQCVGCNLFGNGMILDFEDNLVKEIGRERVDALKARRFEILKIDTLWYLDKIEHYKSKTLSTVE